MLPDPRPLPAADGTPAPAERWWPPLVLEPAWLRENAAHFDLVHLHFGLESYSAEQIADALATARSLGRAVIYTVHDLENPQLSDQSDYRRILDVIVPDADALVTLTSSAAAEIETRWGRTATVIAHPSLRALDEPAPAGTAHAGIRIGVHLRDLRPNVAGLDAVLALETALEALRGAGVDATAVVRLNTRVRDEGAAAAISQRATDTVQIERGPRQDDAELERWIADLDVCLLPYRHGTHSGWAELCFDLAVPVAGTRVGHVASQHPADFHAFDLDDPASLAEAIVAASAPAWSRAGSAERVAETERRRAQRIDERDAVRDAHTQLYTRVLRESVAA